MNLLRVAVDKYVGVDLLMAINDLAPRLSLYAAGLRRIEERDDTLGGEAIFKNTRLSVRHVGKMLESGETFENILEDYPYLEEDDLRFALLYYQAHPIRGRPRTGGDVDGAALDAG